MTDWLKYENVIKDISTHTLTWSVTCSQYANSSFVNFNSHAHVERDDKTTLKGVVGKDFNSHAHVERDNFLLLPVHILFSTVSSTR